MYFNSFFRFCFIIYQFTVTVTRHAPEQMNKANRAILLKQDRPIV